MRLVLILVVTFSFILIFFSFLPLRRVPLVLSNGVCDGVLLCSCADGCLSCMQWEWDNKQQSGVLDKNQNTIYIVLYIYIYIYIYLVFL